MIANKTYLMYKDPASEGSAEFEKLCDIKDFPALGGKPELVEVTTLSDLMKKYEPGIADSEGMEFKVNYDLTLYKKIKGYADQNIDYAIYFGATSENVPDGHNGKFGFTAKCSIYVDGADNVNAPVEMVLTLTPSSEIDVIE